MSGVKEIAKGRKVDLLEIFGGLACYLKLNPGNKGPHRKVFLNMFNKDLKIQFWTFFTVRDLYGSRFFAPSFLCYFVFNEIVEINETKFYTEFVRYVYQGLCFVQSVVQMFVLRCVCCCFRREFNSWVTAVPMPWWCEVLKPRTYWLPQLYDTIFR